jgi:hypothetical protein
MEKRESMRFYDALPKHKAELVDGKMFVGGSLEKSAMTLGYMVEKLGATYVANLVPKDLLRDAVIDVYGNKTLKVKKMADFKEVKPFHNRPEKLASDLRMGLFMKKVSVWGGTMAIKLGEDVFMPDIYLLKNENHNRLYDSYLEGVPDLIIEVVTPYMRTFDYGLRMEKYASAGLQEIWMIDYEKKAFEPFQLINGKFIAISVENQVFYSKNIGGLSIQHTKIFESKEVMWMRPLEIFDVPNSVIREKRVFNQDPDKQLDWHDIPFSPRFSLESVPITFKEFVCWGGEVKFEMMDGVPIFGGGDETTEEWLGLLIMTLGVRETVKYLPKEIWSNVF